MNKTENNLTNTKEVMNFFDDYAGKFDSIYGHTYNRSWFDKLIDKLFRQVMFKRFEEVLKNTNNPEILSIIDIGCGPGHYCVEFLKQGKKVTCIDLSSNMLNIAKEYIKKRNFDEIDVNFIVGDYLKINIEVKHDAACLMGLFDYIENPESILKKLQVDVSKELYISFPKKGGLLAFQRQIRYKLRKCPLYLYSKEQVEELLNLDGFNKRNYEIIDLGRDIFVKVKF